MTTDAMQSPAPETGAGDKVHAARTKNGRLEFLDTLRGIAALVVALQHLGEVIWPQLVSFSHLWWRPGEFGVVVFFVCSGFIIPASMERRGDLKEFWIGRAFRLFPLYLSLLLLTVVIVRTVPGALPNPNFHPVWDTAVNASMLQIFTGRPLFIGASWTLGYEMVFYLLMTVLFMLGWHRRSAGIATGLYVSALVLGGFLVPYFLVQYQIRSWAAVVFGLLALAVVVVVPRLSGGQRSVALTITVAVLLLLLNRPHDLWFSLVLLGSMFLGTVLYRYDVGELPRRTAVGVFAFAVVAITLVEHRYHVGSPEPLTGTVPRWWTEAGTFVSAYLTFGALFLLRRFRFPRVLVYLGTISYSVYLVHALVLVLPLPDVDGPVLYAGLVAVTIGASALTYHFIEKPGQLMGRRLIARYRAGKGDDAGARQPGHPSPAPLPVDDPSSSAPATAGPNGDGNRTPEPTGSARPA
ncbi:acyltransferase family protein [Geodermatophilus sp. SYSU D00691]